MRSCEPRTQVRAILGDSVRKMLAPKEFLDVELAKYGRGDDLERDDTFVRRLLEPQNAERLRLGGQH
jgi:hypothetical protein